MPAYNISDQNDRWLQEKNGPDSLVLDDGSVWIVVPSNPNKVERWVRFSSLSVICDQDKAGKQRYRLVNKSYGEEVEAVFWGKQLNVNARTPRS